MTGVNTLDISVKVNLPQSKFLNLGKKFKAFVGGYGSGKTFVGCVDMCSRMWSHPKVNQGYFAPTYPQIRDIFYPTIEEVAHGMGLKCSIMTSNKEVHFYNGRQYRGTTICRSMDKPSSIVGFNIGNALVDELDVMPVDKAENAWNKIIARMRTLDANNGINVTTTPEGFKFVYKKFVEDLKLSNNKSDIYGLIKASTYDNAANLPDGYIQSMLDTYPDELCKSYLGGEFVNLTSGTVYSSYNRTLHDSRERIVNGDVLRIGMDFNVTNMSAVVYVKRNVHKEWHAVNELHGILDTPSMILKISLLYPKHEIIIYPDATGSGRSSIDASISDIALLEGAGFKVYANATNPYVKDRILATNVAFERSVLFINAVQCPEYARCMEQLPYNKHGEPNKKLGLDHLPDAGTYPIAFEMPIVKPAVDLKVKFAR